ncbi:MAG: FHA domain-containing protein [Myxococcales bacterium]|nr:FHA domain-containing protein [Myxococcales bacterium]MCB9712788.1 FHA domain-containing protein [Myxococcales bacterium]
MAEDDAPTNNLTRFPVLHEPPTQPYLLSVVEGPARGTKVQLREGRWIVGRDPTAQLTINDPHISRQHIEVQVLPGAQGVLLRDLDSKNGSFMRNCRFIEAYVDEHALVSLGENTIVDIALETAGVTGYSRDRLGDLVDPRLRASAMPRQGSRKPEDLAGPPTEQMLTPVGPERVDDESS